MADFQIRRATADDADAIADIFNAGTNASPANNLVTWQESGTDRAKWIADLDADGYPVFVATDDSGVIGFAAYFQAFTTAPSRTPSTSPPPPPGAGSAPRCSEPSSSTPPRTPTCTR